ncbi:MAG: amino acid ABC transporter ATP-binding protein [Spirochaetia bacterium]|nr:amino acid ABC transporter ATP-binding protein [Spirochaetia bacterium]
MEVITVKNIRKTFGASEILKDISFSVHTGEVLGIIGPSGSGKSTLLRCVTQLETVSDGTIKICGDTLVSGINADGRPNYADEATRRRIMLKIGLVFQNFNLFPHFNVMRNITEAQRLVLGTPKQQAEDTAVMLLEKIGLADKADLYPYQLSGGQQQRVSIARALALKPEVLCFDEPTSALDPELTGEILKVIRALAEEKMTMIVVTHEMAFARDLSNKIIFMDKGVIVEEGDAKEVINNPKNERTRAFLSKY